jgi:putative sterol carrier protein
MSGEPQSASRKAGAFAVLLDLTAPGPRDVLKTFDRLGDLLAPSQRRSTVQLRLVHDATGDQTSCVRLTLDAGKATTSSEPLDNPDVELITTPEVWWEIATGKLAPHDAFLGGRMRVRGNTRVAQDMLKLVAASPDGRTHLCSGGR